MLFSVTILSYTAYRISKLFAANNIIEPAGIAPVTYKTMDCNGIQVNIPETNTDCGDTEVPCTTTGCSHFIFRGSSIKNGFSPSK